MKRYFVILSVLTVLALGACRQHGTDVSQQTSGITAEMAYEGVSNYCHSQYDWSVAEDNASMMSVAMGEETPTEYEVIFRSYTGALVHFYVDKATGKTRLVESVPALGIDSVAGNIDVHDYLDKKQ